LFRFRGRAKSASGASFANSYYGSQLFLFARWQRSALESVAISRVGSDSNRSTMSRCEFYWGDHYEMERTKVDHFQCYFAVEAGVNRRCGQMNHYSDTREWTSSFHTSRELVIPIKTELTT
jgi:hypothetical protein